MQKQLLIAAAVAFPILVAGGIIIVAMPQRLALPAQITTSNAPVAKVPATLDEAKKLAYERLAHLQSITQADWDQERMSIAQKAPPAALEDAIARTQQRIEDLQQMKPQEWEAERQRIILRQAGAKLN